MFKRESAKGMGENEEAFDGAVDVNQTYWWHDKYRPRKPRYFNRVHTGYASALSFHLGPTTVHAIQSVSFCARLEQIRLEQVQPDAL